MAAAVLVKPGQTVLNGDRFQVGRYHSSRYRGIVNLNNFRQVALHGVLDPAVLPIHVFILHRAAGPAFDKRLAAALL
ncbi:hypothetical protein D3C81_2077090 [compost metagenome]